jgi:hypothetical protein
LEQAEIVDLKLFSKRYREIPCALLPAEYNPSDQELMMRLLKHMGLRSDYAGNGLEVLDALKSVLRRG